MKPAEKINYLFEAALARRPSGGEVTITNQLLVAREIQQNRQKKAPASGADIAAAALQDIYWAVLNSNEFILQH
jgi:hypothetical protein